MRGPVTSADNPRYRALLKLLHSSRERRKAGRSLLDGVHLVGAMLDSGRRPETLAVSASGSSDEEIARLIARSGIEPLVLADGLFRELSTVTTPTGIIAVVETPREAGAPSAPGPCVLLHDVQDPGNLGSILRSAAAAGVREIFLSRGSVHAWSPRVLRAGMGAHFGLAIHEGTDLEAWIGRFPGKVVATVAAGGRPIFECDLRGRVALLFGSEGAGLTPALCGAAHERVHIPMPGAAESLNVAAAAAVCLFERVRQETVAARAQ